MPVARGVSIPLSEGGQHANVTASRVEASFEAAASGALNEDQKRRIIARCGRVVRATAQDTRSQARNRELALERLRGRLESALATPRRRRATKPTPASRRRRLESKRRRGELKRQRRRPEV